ncbi:hypothetical protein [Enterococcus faecium]|jgi:hypothetical protein|uniref:hypothetical protein n=1 Tax=Enterococcus faecium TaxID=1352 RepID=UPI001F1C04BF|nr:hypothetical protein [Enterococcus faecium]MCF8636753.1 hypothetical protein [Enterococcus faecium]
MKVEEALRQKLLRAVPLQKNGKYPEKYKDADWISHKKLIGQKVALVNIQNKFLYIKNPEVAKVTFTGDTKTSLVLIDTNFDDIKTTTTRSSYMVVTLNEAVLKSHIIELSLVKDVLAVTSFANLAMQVIQGEELTDEQIASLLCDPRTMNVFEVEDLLHLTDDVELIEICKQVTPRARLFVQEVKDGNSKPKATQLFQNKVLRKVSKLE